MPRMIAPNAAKGRDARGTPRRPPRTLARPPSRNCSAPRPVPAFVCLPARLCSQPLVASGTRTWAGLMILLRGSPVM